jgi:hypothetical protein
MRSFPGWSVFADVLTPADPMTEARPASSSSGSVRVRASCTHLGVGCIFLNCLRSLEWYSSPVTTSSWAVVLNLRNLLLEASETESCASEGSFQTEVLPVRGQLEQSKEDEMNPSASRPFFAKAHLRPSPARPAQRQPRHPPSHHRRRHHPGPRGHCRQTGSFRDRAPAATSPRWAHPARPALCPTSFAVSETVPLGRLLVDGSHAEKANVSARQSDTLD